MKGFEEKLNGLIVMLAIGLVIIFVTASIIIGAIEMEAHGQEWFFDGKGKFIEDYRFKVGDTIFNIGLMVSPASLAATLLILTGLISAIIYTGIRKL